MLKFRAKVFICGGGAIFVGLWLMDGPVDGVSLSGAGIAACGLALVALAAFDAIRVERREAQNLEGRGCVTRRTPVRTTNDGRGKHRAQGTTGVSMSRR